MQFRSRHLADDELLLLDDPQTAGLRRLREAGRHLAGCTLCAARQADLAARLGEVAGFWRGEGRAGERLGAMSPDGAPAVASGREESAHRTARARLGAAIDRRAAELADPGWRRLARRAASGLASPAVAVAAVALLLAVASQTWRVLDRAGPTAEGIAPSPAARESDAGGLEVLAVPVRPDRRLTPGAVRPVTAAEACRGDGPAEEGAAAGVPRQVFARYGIDYRRAAEFELDFLITPELGGAAEARNLWPHTYRAAAWNAYVKDELERYFRRLVCAGALELATAQRELATDWIEAYRRRFRTTEPRRDYRRRPLTTRDARVVLEAVPEKPPAHEQPAPVVARWTASRTGLLAPAGGALRAAFGAGQPRAAHSRTGLADRDPQRRS